MKRRGMHCPLPIATLIDLAPELPWSLPRHEVYPQYFEPVFVRWILTSRRMRENNNNAARLRRYVGIRIAPSIAYVVGSVGSV
jgi:hypothetical protein